jgi:hypothetical protein
MGFLVQFPLGHHRTSRLTCEYVLGQDLDSVPRGESAQVRGVGVQVGVRAAHEGNSSADAPPRATSA